MKALFVVCLLGLSVLSVCVHAQSPTDGDSRPQAQQETPAPPLPKAKPRTDGLSVDYPPGMRREGKTGRVKVEFSIDAKGIVANPVYETLGPKEFQKAVEAIMKGTSYSVPDNWTDTGGAAARFELTFIYDIDMTGKGCVQARSRNEIVTCAQMMRR